MAKQSEDAFDVLTFYIYVMALLTAIVGGFALWNKKKVDAEGQKIRAELIKLDQMRNKAAEEELQGWIAREREGKATGNVSGSPADFQALYVRRAQENNLRLTNHQSQGTRNLPGTVPLHASELYAKNVLNLVKLFVAKDGALARDFKDEVLAGCLLTHGGAIVHPSVAESQTTGVQ